MQKFLTRLKSFYPIVKNGSSYKFKYKLFPLQLDETSFNTNRSVLSELFTDESNIDYMIAALQDKLDEAVAAYRYEVAAVYRDMIIKFGSVRNGINGYKELLNREILLTLPIADGRYKLFYIAKGYIINSQITDKINQADTDIFIEESKLKKADNSFPVTDEKSWIDYRDIIFSEILTLPEETVKLI